MITYIPTIHFLLPSPSSSLASSQTKKQEESVVFISESSSSESDIDTTDSSHFEVHDDCSEEDGDDTEKGKVGLQRKLDSRSDFYGEREEMMK